MINIYGKNNFKIEPLITNITTQAKLNNLEKQSVCDHALVYELYNSKLYISYFQNNYTNKSFLFNCSKNPNLNSDLNLNNYYNNDKIEIRCIETQETFKSIKQAAKKLRLHHNTLIRAIRYGYEVTFDIDSDLYNDIILNNTQHTYKEILNTYVFSANKNNIDTNIKNKSNIDTSANIKDKNNINADININIDNNINTELVKQAKQNKLMKIKLHFVDINNPIYEKRDQSAKYYIYIIKESVDDKWIPIYVQHARTSLNINKKFEFHYTNANSKIYDRLHLISRDKLQIVIYQDKIKNVQKVVQLEKQLIFDLIKQEYKLLNFVVSEANQRKAIEASDLINNQPQTINIGPELTKDDVNIINTYIHSIQFFKLKNNPFFTMNKIYKDIKNNLFFIDIRAYAFYKRIPIIKAKEIMNKKLINIDVIDLNNDDFIYATVYYLYKVEYYAKINYIATYLPINEYKSSLTCPTCRGLGRTVKDNINNVKIITIKSFIYFKDEVKYYKKQYVSIQKTNGNKKIIKADKPKYKPRQVKCITTGEQFDSIYAATKAYGYTCEDTIWKACKGIHKYTHHKETNEELIWEFVDKNNMIPKWNRNSNYNVIIINKYKKPIYATITSLKNKKDILAYHQYHTSQLHDIIHNTNPRYLSITTVASDLTETAAKQKLIELKNDLLKTHKLNKK